MKSRPGNKCAYYHSVPVSLITGQINLSSDGLAIRRFRLLQFKMTSVEVASFLGASYFA